MPGSLGKAHWSSVKLTSLGLYEGCRTQNMPSEVWGDVSRWDQGSQLAGLVDKRCNHRW